MKSKALILFSILSCGLAAQNNYLPGLATSGNIGINLPSAPSQYHLEVGGNIGMAYGGIFGVTNSSWPASQKKIFVTGWDANSFDFLAFYTPGGGTGSTSEKMRLTVGGNVGIGSNNPGAKLWVEDATASEVRVHTASQNDAKLTVSNGVAGYTFRIDNSNYGIGHITSGTDIINFKNTGSGPGIYPQVWIGKRPTVAPHDDFQLAVDGKLVAKSIYVTLSGNWADYVFEENYTLPSLSEVEKFYKSNKHLPEIPSAKEVAERGISVGEINTLLLKKIEELTLYVVEQQKEIEKLKN